MNFKKLLEKRATLLKEMASLTETVKKEERAFDESETSRFEKLEAEIKGIDATIDAAKRADALELDNPNPDDSNKDKKEEVGAAEERAFEEYIRGTYGMHQRADDVNLTTTDNGAVIPSTIANKIIEKVVTICPIYSLATRYNVKGTLNIPYYDETTQEITMAYATEFNDLTSTSGQFKSIELKGFLAGALSKVSRSLINNSQFDIVSYVIGKLALAVAKWIENELLHGTADKIDGLKGVKQVVSAASATAVTADELIDVQEEVPDVFQGASIWIMSRKTRKAIRKLKDNDGKYILNQDANSKWGYTLFGKDVYTSDQMDEMTAGKNAIYYGDFSGLAVKVAEDMAIQVLQEKFATQHAVGVIGWLEMDSKVENAEKISALKMKAA